MAPEWDRQRVLTTLRGFFARELLDGQEEGLDASTPLLELGLIHSLSIVMLASFVEREFSLHLPLEELTPANLASLGAIADLLERLPSAPSTRTV